MTGRITDGQDTDMEITDQSFSWAVRGRVFSFEQDDLPGEGYKFKIKTFHVKASDAIHAVDAITWYVKHELKQKGFFTLSVKCESLPLK